MLLADVIGLHVGIGAFLGRIAADVFADSSIAFIVISVGQGRGIGYFAIGDASAFQDARFGRCPSEGHTIVLRIHVRIGAFLGRIASFVFAYASIAGPVVGIQKRHHGAIRTIDGCRAGLITTVDGRSAKGRTRIIRLHIRIGAFLRRIASFVLADSAIAIPIVGAGERRIIPIGAIGFRRTRLVTRWGQLNRSAARTAASRTATSRASAAPRAS